VSLFDILDTAVLLRHTPIKPFNVRLIKTPCFKIGVPAVSSGTKVHSPFPRRDLARETMTWVRT
jgi:hypothetical protein